MNELLTGRRFYNCERVPLAEVPVLDMNGFRANLLEFIGSGWRTAAFFAFADKKKARRLCAVCANDRSGTLAAFLSEPAGEFESMTAQAPQLHLFEREVFEQYRIRPLNHPWLKPVRFETSFIGPPDTRPPVGETDFFRMQGEEVHEVAVGPVHAGIIEPGHFRFQCHGETVYHLEISLGYQHRGVEREWIGGPTPRMSAQTEAIAGDTTVGHQIAFCQIMESLGGCQVPIRAQAIRAVALELERCANHTGDLGALSGDVAYLPTASFCGRIRGDFLTITGLLCGNRFGRNLITPGGVLHDADEQQSKEMNRRIEAGRADFLNATALLWNESTVMARFDNTGILEKSDCETLGIVGMAARACGIERDIRQDFPFGAYRFAHIPVATADAGDVTSRAFVRWREVQQSLDFTESQLRALPRGPVTAPVANPVPDSLVVSLTEGWRGEICHVAITGRDGRFVRYKVVDPSFHNWTALALTLRNQQISDFPLCNKSFNLSYCGFDL